MQVTHDFEEALTLGQRISVLNKGRLYQTGSPEDIFLRPESVFVARYTMSRNIFKGKISKQDGKTFFEIDDRRFEVVDTSTEPNHACIRPESIRIGCDKDIGSSNVFSGKVSGVANRGAYTVVRVNLPPELFCYVPRLNGNGINAGQTVWLSFEPQAVHLFRERYS
jgi:ABC-type Fe3+/spermidine/putrescine transport system ATPase subunit